MGKAEYILEAIEEGRARTAALIGLTGLSLLGAGRAKAQNPDTVKKFNPVYVETEEDRKRERVRQNPYQSKVQAYGDALDRATQKINSWNDQITAYREKREKDKARREQERQDREYRYHYEVYRGCLGGDEPVSLSSRIWEISDELAMKMIDNGLKKRAAAIDNAEGKNVTADAKIDLGRKITDKNDPDYDGVRDINKETTVLSPSAFAERTKRQLDRIQKRGKRLSDSGRQEIEDYKNLWLLGRHSGSTKNDLDRAAYQGWRPSQKSSVRTNTRHVNALADIHDNNLYDPYPKSKEHIGNILGKGEWDKRIADQKAQELQDRADHEAEEKQKKAEKERLAVEREEKRNKTTFLTKGLRTSSDKAANTSTGVGYREVNKVRPVKKEVNTELGNNLLNLFGAKASKPVLTFGKSGAGYTTRKGQGVDAVDLDPTKSESLSVSSPVKPSIGYVPKVTVRNDKQDQGNDQSKEIAQAQKISQSSYSEPMKGECLSERLIRWFR